MNVNDDQESNKFFEVFKKTIEEMSLTQKIIVYFLVALTGVSGVILYGIFFT